MFPKILVEEKDYLIIDKPAGLLVHDDGKEINANEKTLCDFLLEKYPEISGVGEDFKNSEGQMIKKPGIVHRLDKDTSGVMVVARTQAGFEHLKKQFQDRTVTKTYHAFVYGNLKSDTGVIDIPIGRSKKNFRQWFAEKISGDKSRNARGTMREAVTEYCVLKRSADKQVTFVEVFPKTGRTHQIRVHLKSIYHPIVADKLYAPSRESLLGFNRVALHAKKIEFMDIGGQKVSFESEYPEDFARAIEQMQ